MSDLGMQRSERAYVKQRGGNDATVALRNSAASAGGAVIRTHGMMGEPWARGHSEAEWGRTNVTVVSALDLDPYFGALHACVEWSPTRGSAVPLPWSA